VSTMRELALDRVTVAEWVVDHEADAAYLLLSKKPVVKTHCFGMINVDVDEHNEAVGVELLTLVPPAREEEEK